jgi:hypothetical protein
MLFAFAPIILAAWGVSAVAVNHDQFEANVDQLADSTRIEAVRADAPQIGEGVDDYGSIINDLQVH